MSVLFETCMGDIVIDLYIDDCPNTCKNFLKLSKVKYYDHCIFHNIQKNYIIQTGDPTGTGKGGSSIYGLLYGDQARFFEDEIRPHLKHSFKGVVAMANAGKDMNASQFYITTIDNIKVLDGKHTIFGYVAEGLEVLDRINDAVVDETGRPYQLLCIQHSSVLDDPFEDPKGLRVPSRSPSPPNWPEDMLDEELQVNEETEVQKRERLAEQDARANSEILALIGDIPDADIRPPENVLFVCRLNPLTTAKSLRVLFSRFGEILSAEVILDRHGDSLCYGFVEFAEKEACEEAYLKMQNVLFDERHIHVDFSQSVSKASLRAAGGWRNYFKKRARRQNQEDRNDGIELKYHYRNDQQIGGDSSSKYTFVPEYEDAIRWQDRVHGDREWDNRRPKEYRGGDKRNSRWAQDMEKGHGHGREDGHRYADDERRDVHRHGGHAEDSRRYNSKDDRKETRRYVDGRKEDHRLGESKVE
ncbi:uncharacterized protein LOC126313314 isoform X2 [Schistocerca gregaria]|uniref:uncharacterized protein LOC126313314 isoform X2 n=1 Tax=Schistocerca gregaria TaxID=7010 RepID=UPI00211EDC6C|nr:uncharacterized protein LOC126313314 isoform X2 [Schistocerca gregaria]